jgi:hypothetical protein
MEERRYNLTELEKGEKEKEKERNREREKIN